MQLKKYKGIDQVRLDIYLVSNNLVKSRSQATDYIKRGLVLNNGTPF